MKTYFLKFADQPEALEMLADYQDKDGNILTYKDGVNLDVIGPIFKPTGKVLTEGDLRYPEMLPIDGWHVNLCADSLPDALAPFAVVPANPSRVFA